MSNHLKIFFVLLLAASVCGNLYGQNSASNWFQKGLNTSSVDERISAFSKAIELDPNYVEAYFYLGLAYKAKSMYAEAEVAFNKAYFKNPYALNNEIKTRILFEMGLVNGLLGKTSEARDALKGAKEMAGANNALRGRISYELGLIYIQEGDYNLALSELREGSALLPQNTKLFDEALAKAEANKTLNEQYNRGIAFLNAEKYQQAVNEFSAVIRLAPNFKDVQIKLKEAQNGLLDLNKNKNLNTLYDETESVPQSSDRTTEAINPLFRDTAVEPQSLSSGDTRNNATRAQNPAPEQFYQTGKTALENKQWQSAVTAFAKVLNLDKDYKDTRLLLANAQANLQRVEQMYNELENLYTLGLNHLKNKEWEKALENFKKIQEIKPGYKDIENHLFTIKQAIANQQSNTAVIDTLYRQGLLALQNGDWLQAVLSFEKVKLLNPNYKEVENRLTDAKFNLDKSKGLAVEPETRAGLNIFAILGGTLSLLILPLLAAFIFSPSLKARMYLIQGHYDKAALIYEKIIDKKPEKVRFYPILANIYLIEDRHDDKAIRIFERILRLNILTPKRTEINSIVANYYLKQGRTDNGAIAIMEKELSNKINKMQSGAA